MWVRSRSRRRSNPRARSPTSRGFTIRARGGATAPGLRQPPIDAARPADARASGVGRDHLVGYSDDAAHALGEGDEGGSLLRRADEGPQMDDTAGHVRPTAAVSMLVKSAFGRS